MVRRWFIPFVVGCALALFGGCEPETTPTQTTTEYKELTPFAVNRLMVYKTERKTNGDPTYDNADTVLTAPHPYIWLGSEWYHDVGNDSVYWRNGVDGLWRLMLDAPHPNGLAERIYPFPAHPGDKWYVPSDQDSTTLVSNSDPVSIEAGTFDNCYRFRALRDDHKRIRTVWYKPGVGKVQDNTIEYVGSDTLSTSIRLKSY